MAHILIVFGHTRMESLGNALADAYTRGAESIPGNEVRRLNLPEMQFDPVLHEITGNDQNPEPDIQLAREAILWAQHLVFLYPTWWGGMPALLKVFSIGYS